MAHEKFANLVKILCVHSRWGGVFFLKTNVVLEGCTGVYKRDKGVGISKM